MLNVYTQRTIVVEGTLSIDRLDRRRSIETLFIQISITTDYGNIREARRSEP